MGADLFFALVLAAMATIIWFILLRNFTLSDELGRARRDRTGMIRFLNRFTNSVTRLQELSHARDLIGHYITEVQELESLCIFTVEEEDGARYLRPTSVVGLFPSLEPTTPYVRNRAAMLHRALKQKRLRIDRTNVFGQVAMDRKSLLVSHQAQSHSEIKKSLFADKIESVMIVPMIMENRVLGIICAVNSSKQGYRFNEDDLRLLESISSQASLAHEFLGIYLQLRDQQRLSKELEVADRIQRSLLPAKAPQWGEYQFYPYNRSAKEVGGDYYDFVEIDEDRLLVLIADASGKGVPACMIMAMCRSSVHALVKQFSDLSTLIGQLNAILYKDTDNSHFITLAGCLINKRTHHIEYVRAGHTGLMVRSPLQGNRIVESEGTALGLLPPEFAGEYEVATLDGHTDHSFLLYTDGITEATNADGEEFGEQRLTDEWENALHDPDLAHIPRRLAQAVDHFTEYAPPSDDRTIVFIQRVVDQRAH